MGIISSIIAGALMSIQGVFNTRASEKIGLWEINTLVQGSGFILSILILLCFGNGDLRKINEIHKLYLTGGVIGVFIIFTVMFGILKLGPTYSIATILIAQLIAAAIIDFFGFFGADKIDFTISKALGVFIMILGVIIFKWKG